VDQEAEERQQFEYDRARQQEGDLVRQQR
jgi:hypothetical protein